MKVKITNWSSVATWRWDIPEDDVCGICQVSYDGACPSCKYPGDDCSICSSSEHPVFTKARTADLLTRSVWDVRPHIPHGMM